MTDPLTHSGLDLLLAMIVGEIAPPPMAVTAGIRLNDAEKRCGCLCR